MSQLAPFVVYAFATTHDALGAERALIAAGVSHTTIPTPASIGVLCGIALRVPELSVADAEAALKSAGSVWTARLEMSDRTG
ncbi:MAG: DUF3343 domain-containing protein [Actinomycetia bacterium]|nr:DUF3343 domain-containing protein [Actinomycetes bacterium]